jgi:hypothetical protein
MVGLLVLAVASGCGDGGNEHGQATATPTATPSETPLPTGTPTPLPRACVEFCVGTCDTPGLECTDCVTTFGDMCVCRCVSSQIIAPAP